MSKYTINSFIVVLALYVIFAGASVVSAILDWAAWSDVQDWLQKGAVIAVVLLVVNLGITVLTRFVPRQDSPTRKK